MNLTDKRLIQLKRSIAGSLPFLQGRRRLGVDYFYEKISNHSVPSSVFFDIGAHKGEFTKSVSRFFPNTTFFLFEANPIHEEYLKKLGWPYFITALYRTETSLPFFSIGGTGDSLYRETNFSEYLSAKPKEINTKTLDNLIVSSNLPQPDILKIDVQGAELDVLLGATKCLVSASLVSLEMSIINYNLNAPSFQEVLNFMLDNGFIPIDLIEMHIVDDCMVQIDVGFLKRDLLNSVFGIKPRSFLDYLN